MSVLWEVDTLKGRALSERCFCTGVSDHHPLPSPQDSKLGPFPSPLLAKGVFGTPQYQNFFLPRRFALWAAKFMLYHLVFIQFAKNIIN